MDGLFVMGQNPAVGSPNARLERRALANLKWLVVRDLVQVETATFWKDSPEVRSGDLRTDAIGTEVFFFPAAGHAEKGGSFTNTQRMLQWHERAVEAPGDCRTEAWFVYELGRRLKARAAQDDDPRNAGLRALTWDYPLDARRHEPDTEAVLREINGWRVADREPLSGFGDLAADGSTLCGCWIYSGVYPAHGRNRTRDRSPRGLYGHGWGFTWPADRRVLYNTASARPDGRPWSERKKLVWRDSERGSWTGLDTPDVSETSDGPFVMHADGMGWLWVPAGLKDGPLPMHYEPLESPVPNALYAQQANPSADRRERPDNPWTTSCDPAFPHVLTTYRLTEHHTAGGMSRTLSRLSELQPALFCEISPELAGEIRVANGQRVGIVTARGRIEAHALVTPRIRPLIIAGQTVHQIALPWHFGPRGLVTGDVANDLIAISEEPNVKIMESKALLCRVEKA
jgi:formate dehydrogenase major subunit